MGLLCTDVPAEFGGVGGDFRHEAVLYEELARRGRSGLGQGVHSICAHYLLNHGTLEQKHRFLLLEDIHVKDRKAFGKSIAEFQITKFKLAEIATKTHVARVLVDDCIAKIVAGTLDTVTASMAKYWITDTNEIMKEPISRAL